MAEVGSAQFNARANFRDIMSAARRTAVALRDVAAARKEASGKVEIDIDGRNLRKRVQAEVKKATQGVKGEVEVSADTTRFKQGLRDAVLQARKTKAQITVDADLSQFRRQVNQSRAAAERSQAKIKVDADTTPARAAIRKLVAEARAGQWEIRIPVSADARGLIPFVRTVVQQAQAAAGRIDVPMDVDPGEFVSDVRRTVSIAETAAGDVDVEIEADGTGLRRQVAVWVRIAGAGQKIRVPVEADTSSAKKSLSGLATIINPAKLARALIPLLAFPAIVTGVQLLIGAFGALGAAIVGVASQVGPLIGLLGTLPGLALAIGGAFASVKLAFSGVGDALKAYDTQQKNAGKSGATLARQEQQNAKARAAAARQVEDAQRRLAEAQRRASEMREQAARRVEAAEEALADAVQQSARRQEQAQRGVAAAQRSLSSSIKNVTRAQLDLNRARAEALEQLEDLRRQTSRNGLDEERARINIERARQELARVNSDPDASALDRREALLDLKDAELDLLDVQDRRADDAAELAKIEREGLENTDGVIDAKERLAEAEQGVLDAQQALADAQQELTDAQIEGPRQIRDALRELSDAQRDQAQAQVDSVQLVVDAQRDLADAYQAVADAAFEAGLDGAASMDPFVQAMAKLPPSAQEFVRFLIGLKPLLDQLKRTAADNLFPGLTDGLNNVVTMMPLADRLVGLFARTVGDAAREVSTLALDPSFRADLEATGVSGANAFGSILSAAKPVLRMLTRLGAAAAPLTEWLGKYVLRLAEAADAQVAVWRDSGGLARFFDETRFSVENLLGGLGNLTRGLINIGRIAYEVMGKQWTSNLRNAGDEFRRWTESVEGQNKIREYFEDVKPAIEEMGRLLKDLGGIILRFSVNPDLEELIRKIRVEFLPVLARLLETGSAEFGAGIIDFFTALTDFLAATGGSGVFSTFLRIMEEFLRVLTWAADTVPGAKQLLSTLIIMAALSKGVSFVAWITGLKSVVGLLTAKNAAGVSRFATVLSRLGITMGGVAPAASTAATGVTGLGTATAAAGLPLIGYIAIAAAVIAAIAALAYVIYTNWDSIVAFTKTALGQVDDLLSKVPFYDTAKRVLGRVVDAFKGAADESRDAWDKALSGVGDAREAGEGRRNELIDRFDREAQALLDGYENTKARLQKDLDLGLITQKQYDDGLAALDQYLADRQEALRTGRETELVENQKQTEAEVAEAQRRRDKVTAEIRKRDPGFFQRRLEGDGGFDPGMWEKQRRAQREAELAQEGWVGGLQILANRVGYFMQDMVRGVTHAFSQLPEIIGKSGAELWQKVQNVWTLIQTSAAIAWDEVKNKVSFVWETIKSTVLGAIENVKIWLATKLAEIRVTWDSVWDATVGKVQRAWETIKLTVALAAESVRAWIAEKLTQIRSLWDQAWSWVATKASQVWEWVKATVRNGATEISNAVTGALDWIRNKWSSVWEGLASGLGGVWARIQSAVRGGVNGVIGILNGLIRGANGVLGRLPGGLQIPEIGLRLQQGGEVPGTGRGDKVPALLEPREFVHTRASVAREGVAAHQALNAGKAKIVSLDEYRQRKYRQGGLVDAPVQRFARGGLVDRVVGFGSDVLGSVRGFTSSVLAKMWEQARRVAEAALGAIPGQDKLPGQIGAGAGRQILSGVDSVVRSGLARLAGQEAAATAAKAAAQAQRAPRQAGTAARSGAGRIARGAVARQAPAAARLGDPAEQGLRQTFPQIQIQRIGSFLRVWGAPLDQITRFVAENRDRLRVSGIRSGGPGALNLDVFHSGGGAGFNPSKEMLALLQRGEGVVAVDAMAGLNKTLTGPSAVNTPLAEGRNTTIINIEINNPVGEPAEDSIHRSLQRIAAHGLIDPITTDRRAG